MNMTKTEREAARERCEATTEGPWNDLGEDGITQTTHVTRDVWTIPRHVDDVTFIAHARTDLPDALDALDEKDEECMELSKKIEHLELALNAVAEDLRTELKS